MRVFIGIVLVVLSSQANADWTPFTLPQPIGYELALVDSESVESSSIVTADPYKKGSWSHQAYGSFSSGSRGSEIWLAHAGASYFFVDNQSIGVELVGGAFDGSGTSGRPGNDGGAYGVELIWRWYFQHHERCSLFTELGAGAVHFTDKFPAGGTHTNFTPQLGLGAVIDVNRDADLMCGVRWQHVSNADRDSNPGFDAVMIYLGLICHQ